MGCSRPTGLTTTRNPGYFRQEVQHVNSLLGSSITVARISTLPPQLFLLVCQASSVHVDWFGIKARVVDNLGLIDFPKVNSVSSADSKPATVNPFMNRKLTYSF